MASRVTIYDIARAAGVGIGTVSRVLNNHPSVTPETREKIRAVMKELHYQPHTYAQRLAKHHSETVCAIIPFFTSYFFAEMLRGVQEGLAGIGYDLVLFGVNNVSQVESSVARALQRGRVDGILFFSMKLPQKIVPRLKDARLPIVLVDSHHPSFDSISVANAEGAQAATEYLLGLGHRRVGMITAQQQSAPASERVVGYRRALENFGVEYDKMLVKRGNSTKEDGFNREAGFEAMSEFIRMGRNMPTAFFICSDIQAIGAMAALSEQDLRVPQDVSIVGFDDIELAGHVRLTTMQQPMFQMGEMAVERLAARMENPDIEVMQRTFSPKLIIRDTCGPIGEK